MNEKHAYLILAHNDPKVLELLVRLLDDSRNDIYIHVDKKSDIDVFKNIRCSNSQLFVSQSVNVNWGGMSMVKAELLLMKMALDNGEYSYYHLLSGVDLPIKSQDYIHDFFHKYAGKEFIGIACDDSNRNDLFEKTSVYWPFIEYMRAKYKIVRYPLSIFRRGMAYIQKALGVNRQYGMELRKGPQWFSLTHNCVRYVLNMQKEIELKFKYIPCVDEIFLPTIVWNSPFQDNIYDMNDQFHSCMRESDWKRGNPYTWKKEDWDFLKHSDRLFARKFSSDDVELLSMLSLIQKAQTN